ncbi:MAG: LuxR C-terminal-related transcriptional regulator [Rickettsiaceae bacterium]|nr:LuxR C-terminal-related transcriptional regulator [Rickettsiaceae bacterium]
MIFEEGKRYESLLEVGGVKFTKRELDVISCIISGKTPGAIANFLSTREKSIELRTVHTHISNIRRKIEGTSRGSIIEFIEKSNKISKVREYYLSLLMQNEFYKYLHEFTTIVKNKIEEIRIILYRSEDLKPEAEIALAQPEESNFDKNMRALSERLVSDFKILQIKTTLEISYIFTSIENMQQSIDPKICIINIPPVSIQSIDKNHNINSLILLYQNYDLANIKSPQDESLEENKSKDSNYIITTDYKNYYFLYLDILKKLLKAESATMSTLEAKILSAYKGIYGDTSGPITQGIDYPDSRSSNNKNFSFLLYLGKSNNIIAIVVIFFAIGATLLFINLQAANKTYTIAKQEEDIYKPISIYYEGFSTSNLTKEFAEKNYSIIKSFDPLIAKISELDEYNKNTISKEFNATGIIHAIYNLNCTAAFALFKEHNTKKAQKILNFTKFLAENYVNTRSKIRIDFDKLSSDEIHAELDIISSLPELYSITMYFIGRSYIYEREGKKAEKYFLISRDLAKKSNLFEAFLSVTNGIAIINSDKVVELIKEGDKDQAIEIIKKTIEIYKKAQEDENPYILNYQPNNNIQELKTPKDDIIFLVDSRKRITKFYTKLVSISKRPEEKQYYADQALGQYIETSSIKAKTMLEIIQSSKEMLPRLKADSYNNIANLLLELYDQNISFDQFKSKLIEILNLRQGDDLDVIYQIFYLSKTLSRNAEFSKADSIKGLIKACQKKLALSNISLATSQSLSVQISKLQLELEELEAALGRKTDNR